jgi:hypothetical protein
LAYGLSVGFVLAVSFKHHFGKELLAKQFAMARDEHRAMLEEVRAALADFHFELPDAATLGAQ